MFKKSNRNFRLKKAESDEEPEEEKKALEQSRADNLARNEEKLKTKVLSFKDEMTSLEPDEDVSNGEGAGDDDDAGEFKVKKSRESRRIVKEMKKMRKEKERQQQQQQQKQDYNVSVPVMFNKNASGNIRGGLTSESSDPKKDKQRYLINKYGGSGVGDDEEEENGKNDDEQVKSEEEEDQEDHEEKLRRLREEIEIMNGDDDLIQVENETDEEKRSMKLMIKSGIIPDASMIHAARKKREMARQEGDYIPLNSSNKAAENTVKYKSDKSRFIREDDEADLSDYEEENRGNGASGAAESRLSMNFRAKEHSERQAIRDNFLAYEQGSDEEEKGSDGETTREKNYDRGHDDGDSEEDEWEKEQLRKVLNTNLDLRRGGGKSGTDALKALVGSSNNESSQSLQHETARTVKVFNQMMHAPGASKKELIKKSIGALEESIRLRESEHNTNEERRKAGEIDYENLKVAKPILDKQYVYFQEIKAFLRDFIDCYNEKIVEIEKCETKWLALFKQRADKLTSRRQEDIRDQTNECSTSKPIDPAHQRRINDREARRTRRRELREEKLKKISDESMVRLEYNEGLSSDDDESPTDVTVFKQKRDDILKQLAESVTDDVAEDFIDFTLVIDRFRRWRQLSPSTYTNAYVALSLPKLFSPLVRIDLADWNPLECAIEPVSYLESRKWFVELVGYARDLDHDDLLIIPHLIEKTVLTRLISLAESVYDPFSASQTRNFAAFVLKFCDELPTLNSQSANTKKLAEALYTRFKQSIDQDVFVPLYSRQIVEQKSTLKSKFFFRQFWSCVKLYSNIMQWKALFSDATLRELTLDCLFNRYLMISLQNMPLNLDTVHVIEHIVNKLPAEWLASPSNLPQLASVSRLARKIADSIHDDEYKTRKIDSGQFKEQIKRIKALLNRMGAAEHVLTLTNAYELN